MLRLVIVGFGDHIQRAILPHYLDNLLNSVSTAAVTALSGGQMEYGTAVVPLFRDRGLTPPAYIPDLADALGAIRDRPLAVLINTPNALHYEQALKAVSAGADLFVERPIAIPADPLPSLVKTVSGANLIAFTGVQRRTEAPFRYIHDCISERRGFGTLRTIRCTLSVGHRPRGWRANRTLAGGGVVIDSGYHLLDCAAWFATAAGFSVNTISSSYVSFAQSMLFPHGTQLESTAIGHLTTSDGLDIFFDLSYDAPVNSVYERIAVSDDQGTTIALTRNQSRRSATAGTLTHQAADGAVKDPYKHDNLMSLPPGRATRWRPFLDFVLECKQRAAPESHSCSAYQQIPTWNMIRSIYRYATWQEPRTHHRTAANDAVHGA